MAIASAVLHHLVQNVKCKTLFITHYPQVATDLERMFPADVGNVGILRNIEQLVAFIYGPLIRTYFYFILYLHFHTPRAPISLARVLSFLLSRSYTRLRYAAHTIVLTLSLLTPVLSSR